MWYRTSNPLNVWVFKCCDVTFFVHDTCLSNVQFYHTDDEKKREYVSMGSALSLCHAIFKRSSWSVFHLELLNVYCVRNFWPEQFDVFISQKPILDDGTLTKEYITKSFVSRFCSLHAAYIHTTHTSQQYLLMKMFGAEVVVKRPTIR